MIWNCQPDYFDSIHEGKPTEDVNELILKIIDAPTKKLCVIVKEEA